jgi:hypothetical protein
MADQRLVADPIDDVAVVAASRRLAAELGAVHAITMRPERTMKQVHVVEII